ncbi:DUF3147 family protein [Afipia sp. TerB]
MSIRIKLAALGQSTWHEYLLRFLFGAIATVITGLISKTFGAAVGGLFLAFPAIFPASATLVEKHERRRKERKGLKGAARGRGAVALEATGAIKGSAGMAAFGVIIWLVAERTPWLALAAALTGWTVISVLTWLLRNKF